MRDPQTQKYKIKLYTEADGQIKGDGLCDYIKVSEGFYFFPIILLLACTHCIVLPYKIAYIFS